MGLYIPFVELADAATLLTSFNGCIPTQGKLPGLTVAMRRADSQRMNQNPSALQGLLLTYDDLYPILLGRLMANLATLEMCLRTTLYLLDTPPGSRLPSLSWRFAALAVGQELPTIWLNDWKSLTQLIAAFNSRQTASSLDSVDTEIGEVRNAFAHGVISFESLHDETATLIKFAFPENSTVRVQQKTQLTPEWLNEQIGRVTGAVAHVLERQRQLRAQD